MRVINLAHAELMLLVLSAPTCFSPFLACIR
jgi:hypothetical protein